MADIDGDASKRGAILAWLQKQTTETVLLVALFIAVAAGMFYGIPWAVEQARQYNRETLSTLVEQHKTEKVMLIENASKQNSQWAESFKAIRDDSREWRDEFRRVGDNQKRPGVSATAEAASKKGES